LAKPGDNGVRSSASHQNRKFTGCVRVDIDRLVGFAALVHPRVTIFVQRLDVNLHWLFISGDNGQTVFLDQGGGAVFFLDRGRNISISDFFVAIVIAADHRCDGGDSKSRE